MCNKHKPCKIYERFTNIMATIFMVIAAIVPIIQIILIIIFLPGIPSTCLIVLSFLIPYMICQIIEDKPDIPDYGFLNMIISPWILNIVILARLTSNIFKRYNGT